MSPARAGARAGRRAAQALHRVLQPRRHDQAGLDADRLGTDFTLSRILAPLEANRQHIVVLDGVDNVAATKGPGDDHMKGMGTMLTGIELLPGTTQGGCCEPAGLAGGISVDQEIANKIGDDHQVQVAGAGRQATGSGTVWGYTSYTGGEPAAAPENNPANVFNRVFGAAGHQHQPTCCASRTSASRCWTPSSSATAS